MSIVLHDLFESDDGGWLQDPALLDRLVAEKLEREAEAVREERWKPRRRPSSDTATHLRAATAQRP